MCDSRVVLLLGLILVVPAAGSLATGSQIEVEPFVAPDARSLMGIRCLLQDHRGFLWLCSNSGLLRYDGHEIVAYDHDPSDPTSLSGNLPQTVIEDRSGDLWVGTWNGLNRLHRETDAFTRWQYDPENPRGLGLSRVNALLQDRFGHLWIGGGVQRGGGQGGLDRLDPETGRFDRYRHDPTDPDSLGGGAVSALLEDSAGTIWAGSRGSGLYRFDRETQRFQLFRHNPADSSSLADDRVEALHEDGAGRLWVGTWNGLNLFDRRQEVFLHHPVADGGSERNQILSIDSDPSGDAQLLLGTTAGLELFDPRLGELRSVAGLEDSVEALSRDREGALWIGTLSDGLFRSDPSRRQFRRWRLDTSDGRNRRANTVREIARDRSRTLWIGTELGLVRLEPQDLEVQRLERYRHDPSNPNSLSHDMVWSVFVDRFDEVWAGTLGGGVNRLDRRRQSFIRYRHRASDPSSLASDSVYEFYEDRSGVLWVSTRSGLQSFDRESESFSPPQEGCTAFIAWDLHEDRDGGLWLATLGEGLCRRDSRTGELTRYRHDATDASSLAHDVVLNLFEDRRGRLWIATHGGGLDRYDPAADAFVHLTERDGLGSDNVYGLLEDDASGDLWIQNDRGLSRLDARTGEIRTFGAADGVLLVQGPYGSIQGLDGELLFGAVGGINVFRPRDVELNPYPPPIEITDFLIGHRSVPLGSVLERAIGETESLTLSYSDRVFTFELAALSFRDPRSNRFRYRLEGIDEDWVEVDAEQRFVTYTNLDPGNYNFRVLAANNHSLWNEEGRSIVVTVTPPWWATWWFRAAAVLAFAAALIAIHQWRTGVLQALHRAEIRLHQTEKMEAVGRLASAVAHDFNNLLTVMLGNVMLLRRKLPSSRELDAVETAGSSGKALTEQLLAFAREEATKPRVVELNTVIRDMEGLLRRVLNDGVRLQLDLADGLWPVHADVGQLQRVLMNLTVNAGDAMPEGGRCTVETANVDRVAADGGTVPSVRLRVCDDGVGMDAAVRARLFEPFFTTKERGKGTGLGLSTVFSIVRQAEGEIEVDSKPGEGACFEIFLPRCEDVVETPEVGRGEVQGREGTILLVDDETPTRRVTQLLLRRAGYEVRAAPDGPEAIRLFRAEEDAIALVLLDRSMPEMDGRAVHEVLADSRPDLRFLFCTGRAASDFPEGFFDHPHRRLITKPFEEESLLRSVRELLDS